MKAEKIQQQTDPNLAPEQQRAQQAQVAALQTQSAGDTASLMARYGTRLALSGMGVPVSTAPVAAPPAIGTFGQGF